MKTILIADDSQPIRHALRRIFEEEGWNICGEAADGREAIAKAQILNPDILILDLSMQIMDGLAAARVLKRDLPGAHLVLLTAYGSQSSIDILQSSEFSAIVPKDETEELLSEIRTLLAMC